MSRNAWAHLLAASLLAAGAAWGQVCPGADFQRATRPPEGVHPMAGVPFQVAGVDELMDFYGDVTDPQLVVFLAGNQFMVVPDLVAAFRQRHPEMQRIFVETIPPGMLAKQVESGGLVIGSMRISFAPDVFAGGEQSMKNLEQQRHWFDALNNYARNGLVVMVKRGNPKHIEGLADLGREDVRIAMPNPAFEGIARQIQAAYVKAGGEALRHEVMDVKVKDKRTLLTQIHHRQSAGCLLAGAVDAAPVWSTEGAWQKSLGHDVDLVEIPEAQNSFAQYTIAAMRNAPHRAAAEAFVAFVTSAEGQAIYRRYGFAAAQ